MMAESPNYYQVLEVTHQATSQDIKRAYRRLAKRHHPDTNSTGDHLHILRINAAYEVLGDPQKRQRYDHHLHNNGADRYVQERWERTAQAQAAYQRKRRRERQQPMERSQWIRQVYHPISQRIIPLIETLQPEIDALAADPFDDQLMEDFLTYLHTGKEVLSQAQHRLASQPNPSTCANIAASLYHCLQQLNDGLEELERFSQSYDEHYLHVGTELFRIAYGLQQEARSAAFYIS